MNSESQRSMSVLENAQKVFHILSSLKVILVGTVRSIRVIPKTVLQIPQLPCWNFFLHTIVQIMRAYITIHAQEIHVLRAVTDFPLIPTIPRNVSFGTFTINGVDCEVIVRGRNRFPCVETALSNGAIGICLYIHGGGFALCSPAFHRPITHFLAERVDAVVVVPKYRRLPEHTLGDALDDCEKVFDELNKSHGVKISLAGDSAGGALCVMLAERRREEICCLSLLSPWCDFTDKFTDLPNMWGSYDYLSPDALMIMGKMVLDRNTEGSKGPVEIVSRGDYPISVPTLVQVGSTETLYHQINRFSKFIINCDWREYTNMIHVPHFFFLMHSEALQALHDLCQYNIKHMTCKILDR
jgi:acetyl esterase/lipase